MTGSALIDFLIGVVVLCAIVYLLFLALPRISPDETFTQIAKVVIGVLALIVLLFAVKAVLFGGGGALSLSLPGLVSFAIGLIVVLIVIFLAYMAIDFFIPQFAVPAKYVVGGICLIALLYLVGQVLMGGNPFPKFRLGSSATPTLSAATTTHLL